MPQFPTSASNWEEQSRCPVISVPDPGAGEGNGAPDGHAGHLLPVSGVCRVLHSVGPRAEPCSHQCL